jgi:hypothetical protein
VIVAFFIAAALWILAAECQAAEPVRGELTPPEDL